MRLMRTIALALSFGFALTMCAQTPGSWTKAVEPARVVGNIYYVGTEELGAYLIVDAKGLVLLDAPYPENAQLILDNIRKLGFDPKNVRVLIASHAHLDHIGAMAEVKEKTGAKVWMSDEDAKLAARGGKDDFAFGDTLTYPPIETDKRVDNGTVVRVGDIAMTAMLTPGHTKGCTTWRTTVTENGKPLDVVFLCSVSAPGYTLVNNEKYPNILDDYRASFVKLRTLHPDVFLANHGSFFDLADKLAKKKSFIGRGEYEAFLDDAWQQLEKKEKEQRR